MRRPCWCALIYDRLRSSYWGAVYSRLAIKFFRDYPVDFKSAVNEDRKTESGSDMLR
jgi:hypothetical protein